LVGLAEAYFGSTAGAYPAGSQVAVLLPSSGGFAGGAFGAAVTAIREGIETARAADAQAARPDLKFKDAASASQARALAVDAATGGANYVIGPLQKAGVDALAAGPSLPVPTLALNRATGNRKPPANLFQYALSPEDEGASVAHTAWAAGHRSALLLYPAMPWADRLVQSFRNQWTALGGRILGQKPYGPGPAEDAQVRALLADAQPGAKPGGTFVFLVATKDSARAIWPQIRAAGGLPTFATSLVYQGDFDPAQDAALAGLNFVDIPWMLTDHDGPLSRRALRRTHPNIASSDQRLYAMGIDAYQLAPRAADLAKRPGSFYPGKTGGLSVDASGRVHRQLVLGQFTATGAVLASSLAGAN
jgi:outer membrane PBP1 activator LpoA protein